MSENNVKEIESLIKIVSKLPGLGPKSAKRIILRLINNREELIKPLANTLALVYKNVIRCKICGNLKSIDTACVCSSKKYDQIVSMKVEKFKVLLTKYITHCKDIKLKRGSINTRIQALFMYVDQNEMSIPKKKFKRMLPVDKVQKSQKKAYSTRDIQMMLDVSPMLRSKALIHLFAATGIRPTAIHDLDSDTHLKIKHFKEMKGGYIVLTVYAEINEQDYKVCIHPEAATALKDYWRWRESKR